MISILTTSVAVLTTTAWVMTVFNALTMRVVRRSDAELVEASVSILIPMRNEESNVDVVIPTVLAQQLLSRSEVLVVDDHSTDATFEKLSQYPEKSVRVIRSGELLPGWLGKPNACRQLAEVASGKFLVFVDADVVLDQQAIAAAICNMQRWDWDFISPYPHELVGSLAERLIQPLLQWSWMASVPLRLAEKISSRSMTIANGQFFVVKRSAYTSIGGHSSIKAKVLDDLELARALKSAGFRGGVAEGSQVAHCRMYSSARELNSGYTKSLWTAFGGVPGTVLAIALLLWTGLFPILLAISGSPWGWSAFLAIWSSRLITAVRTRSSAFTAILHPLSTIYLIFLIGLSWRQKSQGKLQWRDRLIS